jgi:hypothetical protein
VEDLLIQHVRQVDAFGCGIACVAMVTGRSYADVRALIEAWWNDRPHGLTHYVLFEMLSHLGYATVNLWETNQLQYRPREPWPPAPFADAHIVLIPFPSGAHYVVWLRDGAVLDPAKDGAFTLADYIPPRQVIGVFPVAGLGAA